MIRPGTPMAHLPWRAEDQNRPQEADSGPINVGQGPYQAANLAAKRRIPEVRAAALIAATMRRSNGGA